MNEIKFVKFNKLEEKKYIEKNSQELRGAT